MIRYVDTSALIKLIVEEEHSASTAALFDAYQATGDEIATSAIAITELHRSGARMGIAFHRVEALLAGLFLTNCSNDLLRVAAQLPDPHLRSLDAIHIATALELEAASFVSFDRRQVEAARREGLVVPDVD